MTKTVQAVRGMHDLIPEQVVYWQYLESELRNLMRSYGYNEIRFPIVENTDLFKRTIGEVTDIVEKEMYTFEDRNGDSLTLRPEGTAGCVRAGIEQGLLYNQIQRLWYMGPMFRHERPQKGRYRQFYQFGVETFGVATADIDAELILIGARLWKRLGIANKINLQLNSLGGKDTRQRYHEALVKYLSSRVADLDEDSKRRLHSNPLRVLDSKNPYMQDVIVNAPVLTDYLDAEAQHHFSKLCELLGSAGVKYQLNPCLVRGLDYYCHTVFEWVSQDEKAQNAVCAGGRYDGLVEQLGGRSTPASGFAMGMERVIDLLSSTAEVNAQSDIYILLLGEKANIIGLNFAEQLRNSLPYLSIVTNCGEGGMKAQFKRADKSGAKIALVLSDTEIERQMVTVKFLREEQSPQTIAQNSAADYLAQICGNTKI